MAISDDSVASRAKILLSSRGEDVSGLHIYRLVALIPDARRALARKVANDVRRRDALRKSFTLTVASGVASLADALDDAEPLLLETVRQAYITSASSSYRWQWVGNRGVLLIQGTPSDFFHYTTEGPTVYTNSTDASATMFAGYEPTLATIEAQGLDDELVEMVAALAVGAAVGEEEAA